MKTEKQILFALLSLLISSSAFAQSDSLLIKNFKHHIQTLASDEFEGRAPMTKGDTLAFNYVLDNFKTLSHVELLGDNGLQEFGFGGLREITKDSTYMEVGDKKMKFGKDFIPSLYSPECTLEGEAVYVGNGLHEDYEGKDLKGKIAIIEGDSFLIENKFKDILFSRGMQAEKAGVKNLVIIVNEFPQEETTWALSRRLGLVYVTPAIGKLLKSGSPIKYSTKIDNGLNKQTKTNNVVMKISAPIENNPNKDCIVIGAHYDHMGKFMKDSVPHINRGADDNASGTATLIEVARYFSANRDRMKRDIVFISFGAEERGLVGSRHFVDNPLIQLDKVKAMFNFDMTGRMQKNTLNIRGIGSSVEPFSQLSTLSNPDKLNLLLIMSGEEGTDYASFNRKGVPAMSFSTGIHKDYHSPRDTEDLIDYQGMVKVYNFVLPLFKRFIFEEAVLTPSK